MCPENSGVERDQLAAVLEHVTDGIAIIDADGKIQYVNPAYTAMTGYGRADLLGRDARSLESERWAQTHFEEVENTVRSGGVWRRELISQCKDGTFRHEEVKITPNLDPQGSFSGYITIKRDLTEQRRMAGAQGFLDAPVTEVAGEAIHSIDLHGTIVSWDRGSEELFGYLSNEVIGKNAAILAPPGRSGELRQFLSAVAAGRGFRAFETVLQAKDGRQINVSFAVSIVRDESGDVVGISALVRDTNTRVRAEKLLRASEQLFRGGFEDAPIGICVTSMDGHFIRVNEAICQMSGYSREELLNAPWSTLIHPGEADALMRNMERLVNGQVRLVEVERRYRHRNGSTVLGRVRVLLVRDHLGCPQYFLSHIEDLTERTRAQTALRESEERFRVMADSFPMIMWMSDADGGGLFINRAYREFTGIAAEELTGEKWKQLIHPEDASQYILEFDRAVRGRKPFKGEARIRRFDGEWRWLASYAQPRFTADGEYLGHVGLRPDITDRKQAENALQESEQSYRRQFAENSAVMVLTDPSDGRIVDANAAASEFYGYPREQLQAMRMTDLNMLPADEVLKLMASVADKGRRFEFQHRLADGSVKDVEVSACRLRFGERNVLHSIVFDVTRRRRAEEAVRLSEARLRGITDSAQDAIIMMDPQGAISYWNPAAESILGYRREEAIGQDLHGLIVPQRYLAAHHSTFPEFLHSGRGNVIGKTVEWPARRKDGQEISVDLSLSAIFLKGQWHAIGIMREITERKRVEARLAETTKRLTLAARAGGVGIWDYDVTNDRLVWDEQMFRLYGITREQFSGAYETWTAGVHPDDRARGDEEIQRAIRGEKEFDTEFRVVWPDGSVHSIRAMALVQRDSSNGAVNLIGTNWDITAQKKAADELEESNRQLREATLRANELALQASRANAAKSEFLANMSHEIRTPMNGVIGMTDLVLDTDLTEDQQANLTIVKSSAESLLTVINDILDFSKIEAHKLNLENIAFDLPSMIDLTMKALAPRAVEKNLELTYDISPGVPDFVLGDPGRLRQVLVNLIGNALKFTERGEVVLRVEKVSESAEQAGLTFSVRDTGIGISPDKQESIFEAFIQADASTSRQFGGTGLGLTISAQLVSMMGGTLAVDSNIGRGSIFHFTIYLTPVRVPREVPDRAPLPALRGLKVLAVDDNATNREVLSLLLNRCGLRPCVLDSGANALNTLKEAARTRDPYPLVVVDAHMPQMDGFSFVENVKQDPQLADLKIILLTSGGRRGDGARCRELGISAYLSKPAGEAELLETILRVLGKKPEQGRKPELITRHVLRETRESLRTLVVDDSSVNRLLATRLLEKQGHLAVCATSGRAAMEELEKQSFDLVLMDVQMPEMDGYEATRAIRSHEQQTGNHLPIVAMTAHAMEGDRERCLSAGMDAYVSKPVTSQSLLAAMNDAIARAKMSVVSER